MEVAGVGDKVSEELEAIQIRLGRVILVASNGRWRDNTVGVWVVYVDSG